MSEKGKEKEDIKGEINLLHHFYHEHLLILTVVGDRAGVCDGCYEYIYPTDTAYTCSLDRCKGRVILHEECAEMPREMSLSSHPQHSLIQKQANYVPDCAVCRSTIYEIGYYCSSYDSCKFQVHLLCEHDFKILKSSVNNEHPSHPHHHLTLLQKSISFKCDACGTMHKGSSYICSDCQYWIHESCAALPPTRDFHHLHHHALSLAYGIPRDYIRFKFDYCRICFKKLFPKYWVYHCQTCRYVVHITCAIHNNSAMLTNISAIEDVISLPTKHAFEEMIGSFVAKVGGAKGVYKLHNSNHQLRSVSSLSLHDQEEEEDGDDDEDDEIVYYGNKSEVVCDGCTEPILDKKQKKSSDEYISCGDCKYFLHLACSKLPPELLSHPLHRYSDHI